MNPHDDPRDLRRINNDDNQKRRHLDQGRRDEEQSANTSQRATARLDPARIEEENEQRHARREYPARREEEQSTNTSQRATARLDPSRREEEN